MSRPHLGPLGLLSTLLLAGCVAAGSSPGGTSPSLSPLESSASAPPTGSPTPTISHAGGSNTIILRMATGGGFVAPGTLLTEIPEFSLYGDGTIVYRDPATSYVAPSPADGVARRVPFTTARLSEAQVQAILADAIGPGGLGAAKEVYVPCCNADAPSTAFTLHAGGLDKTVTVGALGFDSANQGTDRAERKAFQDLSRRLLAPDLGPATTSEYAPTAYRGILSDAVDVTTSTKPWPWSTFGPEDFKATTDPGAMQIPTRTLSADEVAALGVDGLAGGADQIALKTTDGKVHVLALRPLLPDERS